MPDQSRPPLTHCPGRAAAPRTAPGTGHPSAGHRLSPAAVTGRDRASRGSTTRPWLCRASPGALSPPRCALRGRRCCAGAPRCGRRPGLATRWRCRPADAAGAGSCQKSRSQIGFSPLKVKVSGLPRPVIGTQLPPPPPRAAWAGRAACPQPRAGPPASISRPGLRRCAPLIPLCPPRPPARLQKPLFNITETFIV